MCLNYKQKVQYLESLRFNFETWSRKLTKKKTCQKCFPEITPVV